MPGAAGTPLDAPHRPRRRYRPEQLRRILVAVAGHLRDTGTRDWCWWHLARYTCPTLRGRLQLRIIRGLALGLVGGLAGGPVGGLAVEPAVGPTFGLTVGLTVGLAGDLDGEPSHVDLRVRGRGRQLVRSLAFGLAFGLTLGLASGLTFGLASGLTITLAVALMSGTTHFLRSDDLAAQALSPEYSFRGARTQGIVEGLAGGLAVGLVVGLALALAPRLASRLAVALTLGLVSGLAVGTIMIGISQWSLFGLVSALRARSLGRPRRLMAVLEDCHRLGLLRTVGPVYQFRHAELQDHLAPPPAAPATGAAATAAAPDQRDHRPWQMIYLGQLR